MEKLLLDILEKQGFTPKREDWFVVNCFRADFAYHVHCENKAGYSEDFKVNIDDVFVFLYSNGWRMSRKRALTVAGSACGSLAREVGSIAWLGGARSAEP